MLLPPALRVSDEDVDYPEPFYPPISKLYSKILHDTAKSFFYGMGTPPNNTPNFKTAWMSLIRKQGVRIYRVVDWNVFWTRVYMLVITHQIKHMDDEELTPTHDIFNANISRLRQEVPTPNNPVLTRGQFFGSMLQYREVAKVRNIMQALLSYTAKACDDAGQDYPAWFQETSTLVEALFNGMYLRKQQIKKYFFTRDGRGQVEDIYVRAIEDGVMIGNTTFTLDQARELAYTIIESTNYVEEQKHVKAKEVEEKKQ